MTADEAIYKMLIRVLKNQRLALWAARQEATKKEWKDEFTHYVAETDKLLIKVMEP